MYLSGDNPELMIGNFIGDYVKGSQYRDFPVKVARGILFHREIDEYTDTHPISKVGKARVRHRFRHYSGVAVDMFYDHFLAIDFNSYHPLQLNQFIEKNFNILQKNHHILPEKVQKFLPYMIRDNWIINYTTVEGIQRSLSGVSRRTPFKSNLEFAGEELKSHYESFRKDFKSFFPDLKTHCLRYLEQ